MEKEGAGKAMRKSIATQSQINRQHSSNWKTDKLGRSSRLLAQNRKKICIKILQLLPLTLFTLQINEIAQMQKPKCSQKRILCLKKITISFSVFTQCFNTFWFQAVSKLIRIQNRQLQQESNKGLP